MPSSPRRLRFSKDALILALAVGWALTLGVLAGSRLPPVTAPTAPAPASPPAGFTVGAPAPWAAPLRTLADRPATLARGRRGTLVVAMASWCLYCGYTDRYVVPAIARLPGVTVDVVDVSPQGGIADPGPLTPPFTGHDGTGGPLTTAQMAATMRRYVARYGSLGRAHVYVAPAATRAAWAVSAFPELVWIGATARVAQITPGALTVPQALAEARHLGW
jgi:hypothetical protein